MRYLFLFLCIAGIPLKAYSQQNTFYDVVYLKQGGYIRGAVISLTPGEEVKIVDFKGKEYSLKFSQIDRIEKEDFDKDKFLNETKKSMAISNKEKPFYVELKAGINRSYEYKKSFSSFTISLGYKFNGLYLGLGTGYNEAQTTQKEGFIPILADLRYNFLYTKINPYMFFNPGFSLSTKRNKGFMISTGVGILLKSFDSLSILLEMGYYWQKYEHTEASIFKIIGTREFFSLKTGVQF